MKSHIPLALGAAILAAGCAANNDKIVFSDESAVRAAAAGAAVNRTPKKLTKTDELKIEQLVYSYLLERHFWDLADYSAVFLQADDDQVSGLMKKYPDHVPPIKASNRAQIEAQHTPLDKDTNKHAIVLSAEVNEPNADDSVDAIGRWYAGDTVTGFRAFHLIKLDDTWQISEVK